MPESFTAADAFALQTTGHAARVQKIVDEVRSRVEAFTATSDGHSISNVPFWELSNRNQKLAEEAMFVLAKAGFEVRGGFKLATISWEKEGTLTPAQHLARKAAAVALHKQDADYRRIKRRLEKQAAKGEKTFRCKHVLYTKRPEELATKLRQEGLYVKISYDSYIIRWGG